MTEKSPEKWIVKNGMIMKKIEGRSILVNAEDIFTDENKSKLPVRISKIGGRFVLSLFLDESNNNLTLKVLYQKGREEAPLTWLKVLPDGIVIGSTWYNLLSNKDETQNLLTELEIESNGIISLKQYLNLKKASKLREGLIVRDDFQISERMNTIFSSKLSIPQGLTAELYPYQIDGFRWLSFMTKEEIGCILGDEMGLGKTIQVIALITQQKQQGKGPSLILAPVSLLENWKRETEKFAPNLITEIHYGPKRTPYAAKLEENDVVITPYNTAITDLPLLEKVKWQLLVVDEAQNIKNPYALRTRSIKQIPRKSTIAVTGTPFENHVSDLWSLLDFIVPGSLGTYTEFKKTVKDDIIGAEILESYLTPLMLRRKVKEVANDLPQRIDIPIPLKLTEEEAAEYEQLRISIKDKFESDNFQLALLQNLRMFCAHPSLLTEELPKDPVFESTKYEVFMEIMKEASAADEKTIVFTSYNKMLDIFKSDIPLKIGIPVFAINGSTPVECRQMIVDEFSSIKGAAVLILNPKAAGTGLNITAATRVIHYNLEWNPALEDQASARAWRRGQTNPVFVYRLFYKNTIEEYIDEIVGMKREMFNTAVVGTDGKVNSHLDVLKALSISPQSNC